MSQQLTGVLYGLAAFMAWGFLPAYWKQMQEVNVFEILCHRIVWSCVFLIVIIFLQKRWKEVHNILKTKTTLNGLIRSSFLIGLNWFVYIWAVNSGHVLEASLGYFINPMVCVLIGYLLLDERFSRLQYISVFFALTGVIYSLVAYAALPVFALILAITFAFYGYSRKKIHAEPIPGLLIETIIFFVPALAYILYRQNCVDSYFLKDIKLTFWMVGAGMATSLPLLWFAAATKRLNFSTIGILQYLDPSIIFILSVFVYKEAFTHHDLITFGCIWAGVFLYTWESMIKISKS